MSNRIVSLFACFALLTSVAVVPMACTSGCSTTVQKRSLQTITSVHVGVDHAYKAYTDAIISGTVVTNNYPFVAQKYRDFQVIYNLSLAVVQFNTNAPAPQMLLDKSAEMLTLTRLKNKGTN